MHYKFCSFALLLISAPRQESRWWSGRAHGVVLCFVQAALTLRFAKWYRIIKYGCTQTQDATTLSRGQEFSSYTQHVSCTYDCTAFGSCSQQFVCIIALLCGSRAGLRDLWSNSRTCMTSCLCRMTELSVHCILLTPELTSIFHISRSLATHLRVMGWE